MHTVAQTHAFVRASNDVGMTEEEVVDLVTFLSENPTAGDEIRGTGGCRKVRMKGRGKGKSGGYRTITFYTGETLPVFLITVFAKSEKISLSQNERNTLRKITKAIATEYRNRVEPMPKEGQQK